MKKIISFMLVICMMLTMLPLSVFAAVDEFNITYMAQVDGGSAENFDAYAASADRAEVDRLVIMQGKTWNGNKFTGWTRNNQPLPIVDSNMKGKPTGIVIDNEMQKIGDEHVGTHHYFIMPAEAVTVYAQYESPKTITISGYQGKGTVSAKAVGEDVYGNGMESTSTDDGSSCTLQAFIGDEVTLNATPNEGYRFVGWTVVEGNVTIENDSFKMGDADVEITAVFECAHTKNNDGFCNAGSCDHPVDCCPKQYQVTFDANGGKWSDGTDSKSVGTHSNGTVTAPEAPTKEGYEFTGWDGNFNANTVHTANTTYKAQWKINQYTITFDTDGGSAVAPITQDYGTAVTAPAAPTKTGYTFAGWDETIPTTMPAENMTITAQWKINQYTITFDTDGGSAVAPITQDYGTAVTAPADPTKAGYVFVGWDKAIPATMPAENTTITAQWTVNKHDVIYVVDGKEHDRDKDVAFGTQISTIAAPTKEGYTFSGWSKAPATMPDEDVTISGTFSINQYTITFDTDGGSAVAPITQDYGTAVTAPADPTKAGYVFVGWDKAIPATMPAENTTITAKWRVRNVIDNIIDNVVDWFTEDENNESLVVRIKFNGVDEDEFKEIKVNLLRNGKKYDSEDLSASKVSKKDWRYEWDNLDEDYNWSVDLAKELKGYNAEVVNLRGNYWTITLSKEEAPVFEKENPNTGAF